MCEHIVNVSSDIDAFGKTNGDFVSETTLFFNM